ncbi:MAG: CocE/NonD family hydrolase [Gammaproteobacteria bacterium]|nr:CocE/NonD family hydrolase [Gammaproteobacteria bacterium]MCY4228653.1 CocE/NonD family hydrolase [Gammaproteobacteria bacterium]
MISDLSIRTEFPREVREIENTWIPMPDGTNLAARIWLPVDAENDPVPAILEYLPYRKRDGTVERDHLTHPYFAGFGYAGVRVDMRGTGDSEGICQGEYLLQEQEDCLAVIEWLSNQPWCSGRVGMIGISWGGFNGLQLAARRPRALGAIISLCSTDDRYADDIHFMGGAMLTEKLAWAATAFSIVNTPPDPKIVGERWREMWLQRLENNGLWLVDWIKHQYRDQFYAHGSICENYSDIEVPTYLVGGWADGYTNAILRMLENLSCPRKGLIGPWGHKYPHFAVPGPRIGFLQECLRWWDQHLKGIDTGIMDEPQLRAWIQHSVPPSPHYETRPGHWTCDADWPGSARSTKTLFAVDHSLTHEAGGSFVVSTPENAGHTAGNWCGYSVVEDGALDQKNETDMVCFDTEPLEEDLEMLGFPVLTANVESNVKQANLIAVLSDVDREGRATRISYGVLNLTHRDSHAKPKAMPKGPTGIQIKLNACGQRISKGHRIRLALSNAYWPVVWPSLKKARLKLANTQLDLPVWSGSAVPSTFSKPEGAKPLERETLSRSAYLRTRSIDLITGQEKIGIYSHQGHERHLHTGIETQSKSYESFGIHADDPNTASGVITWNKHYKRGDWFADLECFVMVKAKESSWDVSACLEARGCDGLEFKREWSESIKREWV